MTKKQEVMEIIDSGSYYDFPGSWGDLRLWMDDVQSKVPTEYLHTLTVTWDIGSSYDSEYADFKVYYKRPETDEELAKRVDKERLMAERERVRELGQLEHLKKKYGV